MVLRAAYARHVHVWGGGCGRQVLIIGWLGWSFLGVVNLLAFWAVAGLASYSHVRGEWPEVVVRVMQWVSCCRVCWRTEGPCIRAGLMLRE
jgi:hypothetical protein